MRTEVLPPIPMGEYRIDTLNKRPIPGNSKNLLYVVHPTTYDGDTKRIAQHSIQQQVNSASFDSRIILIASPVQTTYLTPGTIVNDIRADAEERDWATVSDYYFSVERIKLIGGNLERCLGALYQQVARSFYEFSNLEKKAPEIDLPLNSIYTIDGVSANTELTYLMQRANKFEAITALLTTTTPYDYVKGYGELELISSRGAGNYEIALNGEQVGKLGYHERQVPKVPPGYIQFETSKPLPNIKLNLIAVPEEEIQLGEFEREKFIGKLVHAKRDVLPSYNVEYSNF